jgi:hypothetical protein
MPVRHLCRQQDLRLRSQGRRRADGRTHPDRVTVVKDVAGVMRTVADLVALLRLRLDIMDAKGWKTWQGDRVFLCLR